MITEIKYTTTNTYLIQGSRGTILFDTGWAGTFPAFCRAMGEVKKSVGDIDYVMISHFHPDHMGIAEDIAALGPVILAVDLQVPFLHASDDILLKERAADFKPINDEKVKVISISQSRSFLKELGLGGELIHTPGHSDDSISLWLDSGELFVGDLNPLYELELHMGTEIGRSWEKLLALRPRKIYYGHAKTSEMENTGSDVQEEAEKCNLQDAELYHLVKRIMKYIDKGYPIDKIVKKTKAEKTFVEDVNRMYLTHQNVGVQGILDRIEIKNK